MAAKKKSALKKVTSTKKAVAKKKPAAKKKAVVKKRSAAKKTTTASANRAAPAKTAAVLKRPAVKSTPPLNIDTESLPGFTVGKSQKFTVQASGGKPPYTFQITQGTLPAGLTFSSNGTLGGKPTAESDTTIFIKVTDVATPKGSQTTAFDLQVNPA
jgi:hypothetical protein